MTEKPPTHSISSTNFKKQMKHWFDEVIKGKGVTVSRRGKPVVTLEPAQGVLLLSRIERMSKDQGELAEVAKTLDPYDLSSLIGIARRFVEKSLEKKAKR